MIKAGSLAGTIMLVMALPLLAGAEDRQSEEAIVTSADFAGLTGDGWSGSLRYLDYSSNTEKTIPVELRFDKPRKRKVVYRIKYPGEAQYNTTEKLKWSRDGLELNDQKIVSRRRSADGTVVLITQGYGKDNNRSAEIRTTYSLNVSALTISKDVRPEGEADFFRRNSYELVR